MFLKKHLNTVTCKMARKLLIPSHDNIHFAAQSRESLMKTRAIFSSVLVAAVACLGLATPAFATPVTQTINLGQVYTGTTPNGSAPWLVATFAFDTNSTTGTLTLQSNLTSGNFLQGVNVAGWDFNLASGVTLEPGPTCTGACATTVNIGASGSGPVPGGFNLGFFWGPGAGSRFDGTDVATYTLTFADALSVSPFTANASGWLSTAHVQGITMTGCDNSGWIVDDGNGTGAGNGVCGGTTNVPEPGALGMFGLGVLLIGGFLGWRRRYS
jgi:hypothetical protein